jgi:LuxR family maltose regulon positive regulatory protein
LLQEAAEILDRQAERVQAGQWWGQLIELLVLRALLHQVNEDRASMRVALEEALALAEPEGYVRVFVDEGEPMRLLLLDYQRVLQDKIRAGADKRSLRLSSYADKLLSSFSHAAPTEEAASEALLEPLSERERDILRLIAAGRSNQEIAEMLVIAVSTVKTHINNLYGKLGTNRRTEAIAIARTLGLLAE